MQFLVTHRVYHVLNALYWDGSIGKFCFRIVLEFIVCNVVIICIENTCVYWKVWSDCCRLLFWQKQFDYRTYGQDVLYILGLRQSLLDWTDRQWVYIVCNFLPFFLLLLPFTSFLSLFSLSLSLAALLFRFLSVSLIFSYFLSMRSFDKRISCKKNDFRQVVVVASNRTKLGNDTSECVLGILRKWVERSKCWV